MHACTHPVPLGSTQPVGRSESIQLRTPGAVTKLSKREPCKASQVFTMQACHFISNTIPPASSLEALSQGKPVHSCASQRAHQNNTGQRTGIPQLLNTMPAPKCFYCYKARSALRHLRRLGKLGLRCHMPQPAKNTKSAPEARRPSRAAHQAVRARRRIALLAPPNPAPGKPEKIGSVHCTLAGAVRRRPPRR